MFRYQFTNPTDEESVTNSVTASDKSGNERIVGIRNDIIGSGESTNQFKSPLDHKFRDIVYADYTASGRALKSIESFIQKRVLPWYGNTHSVSSGTARQSTYFREEARHIIGNYFNCTSDNSVIFTGSGATGAMSKFLAIIEAGITEGFLFGSVESTDSREYLIEDRWGSLMCSVCQVRVKNGALFRSHSHTALHEENVKKSKILPSQSSGIRSVTFVVDPVSHHSALLPIREMAAKFGQDRVRVLTMSPLELMAFCQTQSTDSVIVAVMCGMSNITGQGLDEGAISAVNVAVHTAGGLIAWDLATYACHRKFDLNPPTTPLAYTDFAFVSTHKLIGGPGSSGVLLARRRWLRNRVPTVPGGGVVFFASAEEQSYIQNSAEREEAGTPDIVGCIRAGLVFRLQSQIDLVEMENRERAMSRSILEKWKTDPRIVVLGGVENPASVISFNIRSSSIFHHNFIVALLNDLFGIQARGGCACAGPFAQKLLGLSPETTHRFHECLSQSGQEIFRPGFVRIGVHWVMSDQEVDLLGNAVLFIAEHAHALLPQYKADLATGEWEHRGFHENERDWLSRMDFWDSSTWEEKSVSGHSVGIADLVSSAEEIISSLKSRHQPHVVPGRLDERYSDLVWFTLPGDQTVAAVPVEEPLAPQSRVPETDSLTHPPAKKAKKFQVPRKLRAAATQAIIDFKMINPGDKILVGVSGGKDSLSLLHVLLDCKRKCPFPFEVAAATVDPQVPEYQPGALKEYMKSIGVEYHYLSQPIVEIAKTAMTGKQSICAFCSRMKRGMLYSCMRTNGYNVLALGQHLDDLVESFLMSCFRNGAMRTMKANYFVKEKDLRVIRPFVYVRERMTAAFAEEGQLPIIRENCPACFSAPKERHRIKMLLSNEEFENPHLFASMLQSMKPLIGISSALSTKELIERNIFPFQNATDEDDDQGAEETLLPCGADGSCPLPGK
jgi:selenocysteine lyase/cysteine desulfurase/tRNA(Ile)-lysidine synthase TilS/MesJ